MIAPLALAIEAPAPTLPAAGDLEASAHRAQEPSMAAFGESFRRRGHAGASVTVKVFRCRPFADVGLAPAAGV